MSEKPIPLTLNSNYELTRGYYNDWRGIKFRRGKTFVAPDVPYQAHAAKYFPNFQGYTHADIWNYVDTSKILMGKISVVSFVREHWAREQAETFVGAKENPALAKMIEEDEREGREGDGKGGEGVGLQKVRVNYEDEWMKKLVSYCFLWWARRRLGKEGGGGGGKSLVVTRGVDRLFFQRNLGVTNTRVGWVYLVDAACRVRWVGNGDASEEERGRLVAVLKRLMQERKSQLENRRKGLLGGKKEGKEREREKEPRPLSAMMA